MQGTPILSDQELKNILSRNGFDPSQIENEAGFNQIKIKIIGYFFNSLMEQLSETERNEILQNIDLGSDLNVGHHLDKLDSLIRAKKEIRLPSIDEIIIQLKNNKPYA